MTTMKAIYLYLFSYMLLSLPVALWRYIQDAEILDILSFYIVFAVGKLYLTLIFLSRVEFTRGQGILVITVALLIRLLFSGPWMPVVIGAVLFISHERKISAGVL